MKRWILAVAVLVVGVAASTAVSQNDQICFYQVSCGDKMLPCVCLPNDDARCRLCTGAAIGNFCFPCPRQTCIGFMAMRCGDEYKGTCVRLSHTSPRVCLGMTLVGTCGVVVCN
jgi:hypothetical protein